MGFNLNKAKEKKGKIITSFTPIELNEGNVQTIFNSCLAPKGASKESISKSFLFSRTLGYKPNDEIIFNFDKQKLLDNQLNIKYLYGQLKAAHQKSEKLSIASAFYTYSDKIWTANKANLLELLYLGCTQDFTLISPFNAKDNHSAILSNSQIKPTLSPKDPNFQAWWAEHKSEWETPKKDAPEGPEGH